MKALLLVASLFFAYPAWVIGQPALALSPTPTLAPTVEDYVVIDKFVQLTFQPEEVFFFVQFEGMEMTRERGVVLPTTGNESLLDDKKTYLVGTRVTVPPKNKTIEYSILIAGRDKNFYFEPTVSETLTEDDLKLSSSDALRARLLQRKEMLKSWELQLKTQEESLVRLREDASVIGNLSRIIEVKEDVEKIQKQLKNLERDTENLKGFLKLAKAKAFPKNYVTRESQLTQQLSELAQAAKGVEAQEFGRKSRAEGDLQKKLSLLEETRGEDYDDLQRELLRVRRQRMQLEKDLGVPG